MTPLDRAVDWACAGMKKSVFKAYGKISIKKIVNDVEFVPNAPCGWLIGQTVLQ